MIIQSTNKPIIVELDETISGQPIRATLWQNNQKVAEWREYDIEYENNIIQLPLEQEITSTFSEGLATLEIKYLNINGETEFIEPILMVVIARKDKEALWEEQPE